MNKITLLFISLVTILGFAQQEKIDNPKQNFFVSIESQAGLNLVDVLRKKNTNPYEPTVIEKTYFSYGFSGYVGYNFISQLSIAAGLRYNYIMDNIHPVYWVVQPRYYFNVDDEEPFYLGVYFGNKINKTTVDDAHLFGVNFGVMHPIETYSNLSFGGFLELHSLNSNPSWFVGFNFGISIFNGKNNY